MKAPRGRLITFGTVITGGFNATFVRKKQCLVMLGLGILYMSHAIPRKYQAFVEMYFLVVFLAFVIACLHQYFLLKQKIKSQDSCDTDICCIDKP